MVQVPNFPVLLVLVKRDSKTVGNIQDAPENSNFPIILELLGGNTTMTM